MEEHTARSAKIRIRLNTPLVLLLMAFPLMYAGLITKEAVIAGIDADGVQLGSGDRVFFAVLAALITAFAVQLIAFYYIELDGHTFRLVKYFGLGSREMRIQLVRVTFDRGKRWPLAPWWLAEKLILDDGTRRVRLNLMRASGRIREHFWPRNRLGPFVQELHERGASVDAAVWKELGVEPLSASA